MKIISGSEVKRVLDNVSVNKLLKIISEYPTIREEISQIDLDIPGSHRVVTHIGEFLGKYYCKYAVSIPSEKERAKILLTVSDEKGNPIYLINGTWLSHYRTALIGIAKALNTEIPIKRAFILGRGPVGKSLEKFLTNLGIECKIAGRDYTFQKADALFIAITEDNERYIWKKEYLHKLFPIICDFTRHSVAFMENMASINKSKDAYVPSGDNGNNIYLRITGSISYDIALLSIILNNANSIKVEIN